MKKSIVLGNPKWVVVMAVKFATSLFRTDICGPALSL